MLKFQIDAQAIAAEFKELQAQVEADLTMGVKALAAMTHAKVTEMAQEQLHSTRSKYINALDFKEIADGVWVVSLAPEALFIEDGRDAGDMRDDLLKSGFKISKEGFKYRSIPFEHNKNPQDQTVKQRDLVQQIKSALKKENIPYRKIETNADGSPRIGKLHTLNIPSERPSLNAKFPALEGLTIYQNKTSDGKIRRDIMTFRTISEKNSGDGSWVHPGLQPRHFFEKALEISEREWENEILPSILEKYK